MPEEESKKSEESKKVTVASTSDESRGSGSMSDLKEAMAVLQRKTETQTETEAQAEATNPATDEVEGDDASSGTEAGEASAVTGESVEVVAPVYEMKRDSLGRSYATGKRKTSIVRVWIKRGNGAIKVNGRTLERYFAREVLSMIVRQPFERASCEGTFDVIATARGGGLSGQAGALRHGISRALTFFEPEYRTALKRAGFLTRDARIVERKKYGKPKARRSFQFSKR